AAVATAAAGAAAGRRREGFGRAAGDGRAKDGKLERGFFAGAFGAGDFLLFIEDQLFELGFAVVANVFVDGHEALSLERLLYQRMCARPNSVAVCAEIDDSGKNWRSQVPDSKRNARLSLPLARPLAHGILANDLSLGKCGLEAGGEKKEHDGSCPFGWLIEIDLD